MSHIPIISRWRMDHATVADRLCYHEQLAVLMRSLPALAARLLDELDPVERRIVEDTRRVMDLITPQRGAHD